MPVLVRSIEGCVLDHFVSEVTLFGVSGEAGQEDYIKLCTFEAFTQNLSQASSETATYPTPREFALLRNKDETFDLLEISY